MKNSKILKAILIVTGLIGAVIGAGIVLTPTTMMALNGIDPGGNINLLNEYRSPGGALLAGGILVVLGAFVARLTFTSTVLATLFYLSYGFARLFSIAVDGQPAEGLVIVAVLEIMIGLVCAFALARYREDDAALTSA